MKKYFAKYNNWQFVITALVLTAAYISLIFNPNLWTDEAYTVKLVTGNPLPEIIRQTALDVHPPLYYLIAKLFVLLFGSSIQVYKIVSIVPVVLTMLLAWRYIIPWFGKRTAILFLLFLNAIPCVMEYVVQIRMYSWGIFFITLCSLSAYGICLFPSKKYWALLTVSALGACYTHNFSMISAVFIYLLLGIFLFLKVKKFPVGWLLSGLTVSIFYLPWLFVLYRQTQDRVGNYWILDITADTVLGYFTDIFGSDIPYVTGMFLLLCVLAVFFLFTGSNKRARTRALYALCLALVPFLTALLGIAVSILVTPFFIARYLLPCMGILALFLAIGFSRLQLVPYLALCSFLAVMTVNSYKINYHKEYTSTHTEELLSYMEENLGENDLITYNYQLFDFIYGCYFDHDKLVFLEDVDFGGEYDTVWFFDSCTTPWLSNNTLTQYGLTKEFVNILGIEQNDFILYRIYRQ